MDEWNNKIIYIDQYQMNNKMSQKWKSIKWYLFLAT